MKRVPWWPPLPALNHRCTRCDIDWRDDAERSPCYMCGHLSTRRVVTDEFANAERWTP